MTTFSLVPGKRFIFGGRTAPRAGDRSGGVAPARGARLRLVIRFFLFEFSDVEIRDLRLQAPVHFVPVFPCVRCVGEGAAAECGGNHVLDGDSRVPLWSIGLKPNGVALHPVVGFPRGPIVGAAVALASGLDLLVVFGRSLFGLAERVGAFPNINLGVRHLVDDAGGLFGFAIFLRFLEGSP